MNGFVVALEGDDGTGKSTLAENLLELMIEDEIKAVTIKEPAAGYTAYDEILEYMQGDTTYEKDELALLYAINRRALRNSMEDADAEGWDFDVYISDRSMVSSMVYQSGGRLKMKDIARINEFCLPDLILLLQLPQAERMRKLESRDSNNAVEAWEDNHEKYVKACQILQKRYGVPYVIIDANNPPEEVAMYALLVIQRFRLNIPFTRLVK
jgi:dTMP kinase